MKTEHASDEDIQQYLLDDACCENDVREHIAHCERCGAELAIYRMLFAGIASQPVPQFDVDPAEFVLSRLRQTKSPAYVKYNMLFIVLTFACCLTAAAIYLLHIYLPHMFKGISVLLTGVAIIAALIIVIFQSAEMFKKYNDKINTLNFY